MKAKFIKLLLLGIGLVYLTSCTTATKTKMVPDHMVKDMTPAFNSGDYESKVDGVVVLLDASSSMSKTYQNYVKFDIAKAFVKRMNNTMPPIAAVSGLRTFGHAPELSRDKTRLFYGMADYDRTEFGSGLDAVNPSGGPTPLDDAITAAADDLSTVSGNKAVIIVSDGKDLDKKPLAAAQEMQAKLGDRLCIYTVLVGDDEKGKKLLEDIAQVSPCGFMTLAQEVQAADPMVAYVSDVFLTGNKLSSTYEGKMGLGYHKAKELMSNLGNVQFNFDSAQLTKNGERILDQHIEILKRAPGVKVIIEGHTSARGSEDYNQRLSVERASAVKTYFINIGNISPDRLTTIGYGKSRPLVHEPNPEVRNSNEAKLNRRVVFDVIE